MNKILIVDDHPLIIEAIRTVISTVFPDFSVISATSVLESRALFNAMQVEHNEIRLAFIDLHLPDGDGVDLIFELKEHHVPVIALSGQCDNLTIITCIRNGAVGFIQKSSKLTTYVSAMQAVLSGGQYFPVDNGGGQAVSHTDIMETLTERQRRVLDLIIIGKSNKLIAKHLGLAEGTVRNHVSDLFAHFDVNSRTQLIFSTTRIGYKSRAI